MAWVNFLDPEFEHIWRLASRIAFTTLHAHHGIPNIRTTTTVCHTAVTTTIQRCQCSSDVKSFCSRKTTESFPFDHFLFCFCECFFLDSLVFEVKNSHISLSLLGLYLLSLRLSSQQHVCSPIPLDSNTFRDHKI